MQLHASCLGNLTRDTYQDTWHPQSIIVDTVCSGVHENQVFDFSQLQVPIQSALFPRCQDPTINPAARDLPEACPRSLIIRSYIRRTYLLFYLLNRCASYRLISFLQNSFKPGWHNLVRRWQRMRRRSPCSKRLTSCQHFYKPVSSIVPLVQPPS